MSACQGSMPKFSMIKMSTLSEIWEVVVGHLSGSLKRRDFSMYYLFLWQGIIVEMGSNQFQANMSKPDQVSLRIIEGPNVDDVI